MFFKDRNNRQEGILAKSRKQISKAGRLLMALAVGGCLWGQGEMGFAGTVYRFNNPSSDNVATFENETTYTSNRTPSTADTVTSSWIRMGEDFDGSGASNNTLTVNGGDYSQIWVGNSTTGTSNNNTVIFNNGTAETILNGMGVTSSTGNVTEINNGTIQTVMMYGGTLTVNGGTVGNASGGTGTIVNINGGRISTSAFGETLNIYNNPDLTDASIGGDVVNIHSKNLTAKYISGSSINFYLPSTIANGDTVLTIKRNDGVFAATGLTNTTIRAGVEGNANLSTGDTITLIKNEDGIITDSTTTYGTLSEGVSLDYDLTVEKADDTSIVARVGNVAPGAGSGSSTAGNTSSSATGSSSGGSALKEQTNILPQPLLSSSFLTLQGTDRIIDWLPPEDPVLNETDSETKQDEEEGETAKAESPNDSGHA